MLRTILPGLAAVAFLSFSITASGQDVGDAAARQKIAAQKISEQANDAMERSRKQDPNDAKFALRAMISRVRESLDLTPTQRAALVSRLQARLSAVDQSARGSRVDQDQRPLRDPPKYRPPVADPNGGIGSVARGFQDSARGAQKTQSDLIQKRNTGRLAIGNGLDDGAVLTDKEIAFAKNWAQITERRKEFVSPKLTEKEAKLLKALNSTMTVSYDAEKFKAVIGHLQEKTGLTIIMDEGSLRELNLDYEADTVTFPKLGKLTVRTILKKVLGDKGLTYIIKEGSIQVMTPKKASEHTITKTYPIGDLIAPMGIMPPFFAQMQAQQRATQIANMIMMTIEPSYWQPNGPGSIQFFGQSIIIRASAEMHYQLGSPGLFGR